MAITESDASEREKKCSIEHHFLTVTLFDMSGRFIGFVWPLQGQRAQRIEMLLLHEFYRRKFMVPDKLRSKDRERLTKAAARTQQMAEEGYIPEEDDKPGKHLFSPSHQGCTLAREAELA